MNIPIIVKSFSDGLVMFIKAKINKHDVNLFLDTGASRSIIDLKKLYKFTSKKPKKVIDISGLQSNVDTYEIKINKLQIGDKIIQNHMFYTVELTNLNNSFSSNYIDIVDGIIGNDIIFDFFSKIDIDNRIILLKE